jgi:hypothetical protein
MGKTYKHQLKYDLYCGRKESYYWLTFSDTNSLRKFYASRFWKKLRHQWKQYLENKTLIEPNHKPDNFDWIIS